MRMRLTCTIWKHREKDEGQRERSLSNEVNDKIDIALTSLCAESTLQAPPQSQPIAPNVHESPTLKYTYEPTESFDILNDLVIDRGPSPFMSLLELFVDDLYLTTVQADGLVIATPTGSTAYSLSAGGSLVHPQVPAILVTPICPHTLSFRPMLLPDTIELKILVPMDARTCLFISFDGRHRMELQRGDYVSVKMSKYMVPTVCEANQFEDWVHSLRRCLSWNERTRQKGLAPAK